MVEFTIPTKTFKRLINAAMACIESGIIDVSNNTIKVIEANPENVVFVTSTLFDEVEVIESGKCSVNFKNISEFLKSCKGGMVSVKSDKDKLLLVCDNLSIKSQIYTFKETSKKSPSIPFTIETSIPYSELVSISKALPKDSEIIELKYDKDGLVCNANGANSEFKWVIESECITEEKFISVMISSTYFKNIISGLKGFDNVTIKFQSSFPVSFQCHDEVFDTEYLIAPRIYD